MWRPALAKVVANAVGRGWGARVRGCKEAGGTTRHCAARRSDSRTWAPREGRAVSARATSACAHAAESGVATRTAPSLESARREARSAIASTGSERVAESAIRPKLCATWSTKERQVVRAPRSTARESASFSTLRIWTAASHSAHRISVLSVTPRRWLARDGEPAHDNSFRHTSIFRHSS